MAKFDVVIAAKTVGEQGIKRLGNSMQGVQGKVKNLKIAVGGLNGALKIFAGVLAAGAFTRFVKGAIDSADAFGKMSDQTGIAANTLQAYVNAGKLAGIEQATIDKGLRRLSQSMREADLGVATYKDSFDALGLSVRDTDGSFKSNEQVLGEIADRFADMPDGATKAALAMEIFGRSGASMINMLNGGKAALTEFNYAVSDEFAQNAEYFNDQIAVLQIRFDGFRKQLADALLPTLNNLLKMFSNIFSADQDFEAFFQGVEVGLKIISSAVFTVVAGFRFLLTTIKSIVKGLDELRKGNFGGAGDAFKGGLKETNEQFKKDMKVFKQIFEGEEFAGSSYFVEGTEDANKLETQLDKTFGTQMQTKMGQFVDSIKTVGEAMTDVAVKSIKQLEDQLVQFVTKGTFEFRKLANSIINDLARIAIQQTITQPLGNWFEGIFSAKGNAFSNGQHLTEYAKGGVINSPHFKYMANGGIAVAGEGSGAEAILPLKRGADGNLGVMSQGGGSNVVNVSVNAENSNVEGDNEKSRQLGQAIAAAVQAEIVNQQRAGGLLYG
nr:putative phage tail length tape measure protein [uncultured Mediterranean phage uvMED]